MRGGLLVSLAAHLLAAALIFFLLVPRQIDTPPEVEVELATGNPAPPPAPDAAPPTQAQEPQPPSPPSPTAEPPTPPPTETTPPPPSAPPGEPATPPVEPAPPPAPADPKPPIEPPTPPPDPPAPPPAEPAPPAPAPPAPPPPPPPPPKPPTPPTQAPAPARPPVPPAQATPPSPPPAVRLTDGITSTKVEDNPYNPELGCKNLQNRGPDYPEGARRRGETGDPKLRVHLDSNGRAFLVEILESSGHRELDEAARSRLLTWRCLPPTLGGKRVPDMFDIRIHFALE